MALLNPHKADFSNFDKRTQDIFQKTIQFFESKGLAEMKKEDHEVVWYTDFLDFLKENQVFYNFLTPSEFGDENCRWDTARNTAFSEILGFYSLSHWYTWQVSILGLGPIWIGNNDEVKKRTAQKLKEGHVFAFGLSEKEHGADLISSDMELIPEGDGKYVARGDKYYIGNGNVAGYVSIFAKLKEKKKEYVFFVVETDHTKYECTQNVVRSQKYVAELVLHDYPITDADIVSRGRAAWDASLATVAFAKFNLGLASVGIATHSFYEALNHASARKLYGNYVTDFPHIKQLFNEAYARLVAMRMFSYRAKDYMRIASGEDRRYLLFNPLEKMKVTLEGEKVIERLWDVIAARGFEKDVYFESATRDIRMLPKLEGTVHVNMMLAVRFMNSFLFDERPVSEVEASEKPHEENFLFNQGATTKGLDEIPFGPWKPKFQTASAKKAPNVAVLMEQIETFIKFLKDTPPSAEQGKDIDWMLAVGEIFSIISYSSLILEQAEIGGPYAKDVNADVLDQIFSVFVRDISGHAVELFEKSSTSEQQQKACMAMVKRPAHDQKREERVFSNVMSLKEAYRMKP
ncbi:MAG TPA: acyl-CoA dehydrogenase [Leptospiraceae bacterium]|nr:acyl-CoA dehydrogenase [Leptospiraceae bacterium]